MNMRIYCFMSNYTNQAGYVELRDGWKNAWRATLERVWKSFPQSARPTLRYISPEFGCRSLLRRPHPGEIYHKLWCTSCRKLFFKQALRFICASKSTEGGCIVSSKKCEREYLKKHSWNLRAQFYGIFCRMPFQTRSGPLTFQTVWNM